MALADGAVWLRHDRHEVQGMMVGGHDGVVLVSDLRYPTDEAGDVTPHLLELTCPSCRTMSIQPVGGGALCDDDTRILQQVFVEKLVDLGWHHHVAMARVEELIALTDVVPRNLLHDRPATVPDVGEQTMPNTPSEPRDLGADIVREIDRTLATPFTSRMSPLLREVLDELVLAKQAAAHYRAAHLRVRATLQAAAELRDADVTVT